MTTNIDDLIEAVGYLACDLGKDLDDADIQVGWKRLLKAIGEEPDKLTAEQIEELRTYAA